MNIPDIEKLRGHYVNSTEELDDGYFETHELGHCVQYDNAKELYDAAVFWKSEFEVKQGKLNRILDRIPDIQYDQPARDAAFRLSSQVAELDKTCLELVNERDHLLSENKKLAETVEKLKCLLK